LQNENKEFSYELTKHEVKEDPLSNLFAYKKPEKTEPLQAQFSEPKIEKNLTKDKPKEFFPTEISTKILPKTAISDMKIQINIKKYFFTY